MKDFFALLKKGNKASLVAAIVNTVIAISKVVTYIFTANVAMLASMFHSFGDAANQYFVFIGSALSKKAPTERFPNGFGRLVNLVLLGAVLIVAIMSYEAIREGVHHILHPSESVGFLINVVVLGVAIILELFVLFKAMKEIIHETHVEAKGFAIIPVSLANLKNAKPATKLVFLEDIVATTGGVLALAGVVIAHFTSFYQAEGIASIVIGVLMFIVVGKVFLDNAAGVIGESDEEMEQRIGDILIQQSYIKDVKEVVVVKEGEFYHVDIRVEVEGSMTVAEANDLRDELVQKIKNIQYVSDVSIELIEDDGIKAWESETTIQ